MEIVCFRHLLQRHVSDLFVIALRPVSYTHLMILIHSLFMLTIMILIRIVVNNMLASFTCILMLEILSIYASAQKWFSPKYCPFVWGMYNVCNQTYPNKGYDIEKAIVLSVVFIIVLNAAIFVDKKLLKRRCV